MNNHKFTEKTAYESFANYCKKVDEGVKSGLLDNKQARHFVNEARKNYKNLSLNREIDRGNV